ncbi:MAG: PAS domain-containing sensor histidine kinase [Candidatus Obscuribacterales bacterium]|nr:PAS domain-containing sensor histidine kinase [Candidatus Obscuribacterales bacterium]
MTTDPKALSDSSEQLRHWYLARLRSLAQEKASRTLKTPSGIMASDKRAIRLLVESAAHPRMQKPEEAKNFLPFLMPVWLLFQVLSLGLLFMQENSLMQALARYGDFTVLSLVPNLSSIKFASAIDRFCFFAFFILPGLSILLIPARNLYFDRVKILRYLLSDRVAIASFLLLLAVVFLNVIFSMQHAASGPEALSLAGDSPDDNDRSVLAWACFALILPIMHFKSNRKQEFLLKEKLDDIQSELQGQAQKTVSVTGLEGRMLEVEESVQELLQRERAIADFSKTVNICFDNEMMIEAVSLSSFAQWGYYQHELLGQNLERIIFREDYQRFKDALRHGSFEHYARIRKSDNSIMDISWFIEWSESLQKYFATCEDISDRMNLERARNDYIAQLTHDMRSPLSGVSMSLELISENVFGEVPEKMMQSIETSRQSLSRVLQLINDILEAEKLRHSKQSLAIQSLDLGLHCKQAIEEIRPLAMEKKVRLSLAIQAENVIVRADKKLLMRVFANLLSNAISFSGENDEVKLVLQVASDIAVVQIMDNGPGIHRDYHQVIFERFGAPKLSASQERQSTGIGLSFCRDIVVAQGGLIGLESEPGKGSTFWFTIPLERRSRP